MKNKTWIISSIIFVLFCIFLFYTLHSLNDKSIQRQCLTLYGTLEKDSIDNIDKETNKTYREMYVFTRHNDRFYAIYTLPEGLYCGCQIKKGEKDW